MKMNPICRKVNRRTHWLIGAGLALAVLCGCQPEVQTTILGGLQSFAGSLLDAFFLNLQPQTDTNIVTTQAVTEAASWMLG